LRVTGQINADALCRLLSQVEWPALLSLKVETNFSAFTFHSDILTKLEVCDQIELRSLAVRFPNLEELCVAAGPNRRVNVEPRTGPALTPPLPRLRKLKTSLVNFQSVLAWLDGAPDVDDAEAIAVLPRREILVDVMAYSQGSLFRVLADPSITPRIGSLFNYGNLSIFELNALTALPALGRFDVQHINFRDTENRGTTPVLTWCPTAACRAVWRAIPASLLPSWGAAPLRFDRQSPRESNAPPPSVFQHGRIKFEFPSGPPRPGSRDAALVSAATAWFDAAYSRWVNREGDWPLDG